MENNNRRYFKSLEELNSPESIQPKEFESGTPGKNIVEESDFDLKSSRRDFLKFMGFGISAATLAACTKTPVKKAIPYAIKPHEVDPGVPNYYATYYADGGYGVLVKTREGRPIKIEGNDLDPLSLGGTTAAGQASVLSLYDEGRLKGPVKNGVETTWETIDREVYPALRKITASGGKIAILSAGIDSPSTLRAISKFKETHPSTTHVQYDAISYAGIRDAYAQSMGKAIIPSYDISKAKTIVSFNADFLGTWLSPLVFTKQYSAVRDVTAGVDMSYHVQFESTLSLSGSKADLRVPCKPSEQGAAMVAVYNELASLAGASKAGSPGSFNPHCTPEKIKHVAQELWNSRNEGSLVICGSNDSNEQAICIEINKLLGSYGKTIDTNKEVNMFGGSDKDMKQLVQEMKNGAVKALIVYGVNPSYNYNDAAGFNEGLGKVELTVSLSDRMDETAQKMTYVAPDSHWLESWNDHNPVKGQYSLSQPTIRTIFNTRQAQESILSWGKAYGKYYDFIRETWMMEGGYMAGSRFENFWKMTLHDGVYVEGREHSVASAHSISESHTTEGHSTEDGHSEETHSTETTTVSDTTVTRVGLLAAARNTVSGDRTLRESINDIRHGREDVSSSTLTTTSSDSSETVVGGSFGSSNNSFGGSVDITSIATALISAKNTASGTEISLYQKTGIMDGRFSNNPWLLELPDSVSKVAWDNYACMSPVFASENGYQDGDLISVSANGTTIENVPVLLQPGQLSGTISIAVGYGRNMDATAGRVANGVGVNVYPLVQQGSTRLYNTFGEINKTGGGYELAKTQTHHHIQIPAGLQKQDRASTVQRKGDIVKETNLEALVSYREKKAHGGHDAGHDDHGHGHGSAPVDKVYAGGSDQPDKYKHLNIYPDWKDTNNYYKALHWGMSVNLNTCTGCNACVIACQSENNIPVVGKKEVMRRRELHWLRIDRYFATDDRKEEDRDILYTDNPSVMFQPLMCQHCDNAPCENVCPVNAINHSSEGINQQIYNRCMGTRYCANNCPYKVRRFNWFAYYDNEKFNYNFTMNSGLGRMVLNPDVTVRARGVMEKCNFCTQRIQAAKLKAKTENRGLRDGDVQTACQQACPANAIQFGNTNDPHSKVSQVKEGDLSYRVVELLNTNNSVYYTTQIRNIKLASQMPVDEHSHETEEAHS